MLLLNDALSTLLLYNYGVTTKYTDYCKTNVCSWKKSIINKNLRKKKLFSGYYIPLRRIYIYKTLLKYNKIPTAYEMCLKRM